MRTKRIIFKKKIKREKIKKKKLKPFEITAEQEDEDNYPRLMTAEKFKLNRVW